MITLQSFRCGICWKDYGVGEYGCDIGPGQGLPLCCGCVSAIKSGIPAEVHMMMLGLSEHAAVARASVLRAVVCGEVKPTSEIAERAHCDVLERAAGRLEAEQYHHRCGPEEAGHEGDPDAVEQVKPEVQHTQWLLGLAELILPAATRNLDEMRGG